MADREQVLRDAFEKLVDRRVNHDDFDDFYHDTVATNDGTDEMLSDSEFAVLAECLVVIANARAYYDKAQRILAGAMVRVNGIADRRGMS